MKFSVIASIVVAAGLPALAQEEITNPGFEYGWSGWTDVDPNKDATAVSGHFNTGVKSAKILRSGGHFEQEIPLYPESDYVLRAFIKGPGLIGIIVDGEDLTAKSDSKTEEWLPVEIAFSSGRAMAAVIRGDWNGAESRFDDFELIAKSGPALAAAEEAAKGPKIYATIPGACERMSQLRIRTAEDDGSNDGHTPEMAIDADFDPESRWSSKFAGKELTLDMGMPQTLKEIGFAFYKGNERQNFFAVSISINGFDWVPLIQRAKSAGITTAIERFDFDDRVARHIKVIGLGNQQNEWNSIVEVQAYGCGLGEIDSEGDGSATARVKGISAYGLKLGEPPSENFDLAKWKITLPIDADGDGKADEISEALLANGWSDERFFYTDPATGGMVFRVFGGNATTPNSRYQRVELREMLRAGDGTIPTRNADGTPTMNNWVFSSAPEYAQSLAGGVDGTLRATLAVNQVTRLGMVNRVGRVIIGQIHAKDAEPFRLYYRKLPINKYGSLYYVHERAGQADIVVPLVGESGDYAENPENGIALDEVFTYEVSVSSKEIDGSLHPILDVRVVRDDGTVIDAPPLDMSDSGYSKVDEFMYFKAGAYSQNDSEAWRDRDFDQVTFFAVSASH